MIELARVLVLMLYQLVSSQSQSKDRARVGHGKHGKPSPQPTGTVP